VPNLSRPNPQLTHSRRPPWPGPGMKWLPSQPKN
jgi:hypothetical protein